MNDAPHSDELAEIAALRQIAGGLVERIDSLLAKGARAIARGDAMLAASPFPVSADERFAAEDLSPADRHVFREVLAEWRQLDSRISEKLATQAAAAPRTAGTRAVASRYRI